MKKILLLIPLFAALFSGAQTTQYPSFKISLVGMITPNTDDAAPGNRRYSGCWGWYQQSKNKEYAISGTSKGTYFIDVTSPATPTVCDYVAGAHGGCIWREIKSYDHYCYIVSDDVSPNRFQIVDMQYLPDSVHVVYDGNTYFERAHTIWVDNNKLYAGGVTYTAGHSPATVPMAVFSLTNPASPTLLRTLDQDVSNNVVNYVHDMYARNDTVYASCAFQGLFIYKLSNTAGSYSFTPLGSFTGYESAGYSHSSSLTKNGKYLVFCDEVPTGLPIHMVDVQNLSNIQSLQTLHPYAGTTPHNPYVLGNDFAVVSCYQDGLHIYNISQPGNMSGVGYFDTYPQGGNNTGTYNNDDYEGNWGAYPYLPSGIIIAQDMQNGVFLLDASQAFNNPVGIRSNTAEDLNVMIYPNPVPDRLAVNYRWDGTSLIQLKDLMGRVVYEKHCSGSVSEYIDVKGLESGSYVVSVSGNGYSKNKAVIIHH